VVNSICCQFILHISLGQINTQNKSLTSRQSTHKGNLNKQLNSSIGTSRHELQTYCNNLFNWYQEYES
jgi:hypothetical protein